MTDRDVEYIQRRLEGKKEYVQWLRDLEYPGGNGGDGIMPEPIVQRHELLD